MLQVLRLYDFATMFGRPLPVDCGDVELRKQIMVSVSWSKGRFSSSNKVAHLEEVMEVNGEGEGLGRPLGRIDCQRRLKDGQQVLHEKLFLNLPTIPTIHRARSVGVPRAGHSAR